MPKDVIDCVAAEQDQLLHLREKLKDLLARSRWLRAQSAELVARSAMRGPSPQ